MARPDFARLPQLSVLDRLIDDAPELERDPPRGRAQAIVDLRNAARRDLEMLLNTRQRYVPWPRELGSLDESVLNYGIPDFSSANLATQQTREEFRRAVETSIRRFEPRFIRVSVVLVEPGESLERTLRFRIEALMRCDPEPEPVIFDSVLDPASRSFAVRSALE